MNLSSTRHRRLPGADFSIAACHIGLPLMTSGDYIVGLSGGSSRAFDQNFGHGRWRGARVIASDR